jgi:hypothetical protein
MYVWMYVCMCTSLLLTAADAPVMETSIPLGYLDVEAGEQSSQHSAKESAPPAPAALRLYDDHMTEMEHSSDGSLVSSPEYGCVVCLGITHLLV